MSGDLASAQWCKSSWSGQGGADCVEVAAMLLATGVQLPLARAHQQLHAARSRPQADAARGR